MSVLIVIKEHSRRLSGIQLVKTITRKMHQRKIAVCQMTSTNDKDRNFDLLKKMVHEAKQERAQIAFFPEACDFVGSSKEETFTMAEPICGPLVEKYKQLAKVSNALLNLLVFDITPRVYLDFSKRFANESAAAVAGIFSLICFPLKMLAADSLAKSLEKYKCTCGVMSKNNKSEEIWLSLGGIHESVGEKKLKNTHLIINNEGEIVGNYSKTHLFDIDIPSQNIRLMESSYVIRGDVIPEPVNTPVGKVGLSICYDMRFPELSLALTRMGAEILTYPSAFTYNTGSCHWEILLRAKAVENQCYVVAAAQTGMHNKKRSSWGHSLVIDPWGAVIAQSSEGEGIIYAEINLDYLKQVRTNLPVWNHRRYDLYPVIEPKKSSTDETRDIYDFGQVKIRKESIFYKTGLTIAFTNKKCVVPGHVLIAPIRCVKRLVDLTPEETADMFQVSQKVVKVMENLFEATSSSVVVQDGPEAGQTITHVHVHVLPRKKGDYMWNDQIYHDLQTQDNDSKPWRTEEEMSAEASVIRKAFDETFS